MPLNKTQCQTLSSSLYLFILLYSLTILLSPTNQLEGMFFYNSKPLYIWSLVLYSNNNNNNNDNRHDWVGKVIHWDIVQEIET